MIDLRSDVLTQPTPDMLAALHTAVLGDDVFEEDDSTKRLEALAAQRLGKKAALLVTSGTQGNLLALLAHAERGAEVILDADSHLFWYEVGGISSLAGLTPRCLPSQRGMMDPAAIERAIRPEDVHQPRTGLLCLENTHNRAGGVALTAEQIASAVAVVRPRGIRVHLDGARIFNAAVTLGVEAAELSRSVDSVTFCLSKGLSAPIGSVLCGESAFIARARKLRKMVGGGLRQAGWIAAAGLVALEQMAPRLAEDHANARALAERLADIPGIDIDLESVQTNIVCFGVAGLDLAAPEFVRLLADEGVRASAMDERLARMVTYRGISRADVLAAAEAVARLAASRGQTAARTVPLPRR